jgi:hypothetical protein
VDYLGRLADEDYNALFEDGKALHETRLKREQEEADERLRKEVEAAQERERLRQENERLEREAAEAKRVFNLEAERRKAFIPYRVVDFGTLNLGLITEGEFQDLLASHKADYDARVERERQEAEAARLEREKADAARIAKEEKDRKEREAIAKKHAAEQKAQDDKFAELKAERAKLEAQIAAKKKQDDEAEARRQEEAEKAAQAPDKVKLAAYLDALVAVGFPVVKTKKAAKVHNLIVSEFADMIESFRAYVAKL